MYKIVILAVLTALTACATPSDITRPIQALKGEPASDAIKTLGVPHSEEVVLGQRVLRYKYSDVRTSGAIAPAVAPDGSVAAVPYTQVRRWYCDIDLLLDEGLAITDVQIRSNSVYYCPKIKR